LGLPRRPDAIGAPRNDSWKLPNALPFHQVKFINIDRLATAINSDYYSYANSSLSRSHHYDKYGKYLPGKKHGYNIARESDQRYIHRIEHNFNTHQNDHSITLRQNSVQPDAEKNC